MRGGAQSRLMLASDGNLYVVKFRNNPQHPRVLANELLATRLAAAIGLTVPHAEVVEVTEWLVRNTPGLSIDLKGERAPCQAGLQFGSRLVGGLMPGQVVDYLPDASLLETRNLAEFAEFERAGVWALMRKQIAAADYTRAGDGLRIDCGYRPNGIVRMFHAVSLESDSDTAKILAFSMRALKAGIARVENAMLELTAVVEPIRRPGAESREDSEPGEDRVEQYRFAVETMEEHEIRVMTTSDLPRIAGTARRELHV